MLQRFHLHQAMATGFLTTNNVNLSNNTKTSWVGISNSQINLDQVSTTGVSKLVSYWQGKVMQWSGLG